ncbi:MAG: hypothetical protein IJU84_07845 [Clostridia bacterium]|nr:hypothetical protein [Clostridia bacterium]
MKKTFVQGTEGRAFLGALLFGPIGAIIGASGDREIYEVLSGITFKFILSDKNTPSFLFKITSEVISCDSSDFDIIKEKVFNLETILKKIIISSANTERLLYGKSQKPLREQLSELKSLYDEGLISKDVYDDAQKNLLRS